MTNDKEKAAPTTETALPKSLAKHSGNSAFAQRLRLLIALKNSCLSTIEIRRDLDIMQPAPRIHELRGKGHKIITTRRYEVSEGGGVHWVGVYTLTGEAQV